MFQKYPIRSCTEQISTFVVDKSYFIIIMTNSRSQKIPELLSPAGSIECFHAAIEAGADAVYLGLEDFNARLRARNFTVKTVSYLVPYARKRNVKIYVTLNTQIKTNELEKLIHLLYQLSQTGIDGIIVADLGLIKIAQNHFPSLKLHASTQMAIHNRTQIEAARKMGISRAVLARELSLDEIILLQKNSPIELEIFVHGALCYSISGFCLASSFLGGSSGNRGRCTQVCRRKFYCGSSEGYFFSPDDFCAVDYIEAFIKAGIASLKIEGRMKGTEYVHKVVSSYRKLLDNPQLVREIKESLQYDMGRPKTTFFLDSTNKMGIINHLTPSGTGLYAGEISEITQNIILVRSRLNIDPGDRIRIQPHDGFEGKAVLVESSRLTRNGIELILKKTILCSEGDSVFVISKSQKNFISGPCKPDLSNKPVKFNTYCNNAIQILKKSVQVQKLAASGKELWVKIDNPQWLDFLISSPCQHLIFAADAKNMEFLLANEEKMRVWRSRLIPSLPPFIPEKDIVLWKSLINRFRSCGVRKWACTSFGQNLLFKKKDTILIADNPIGVLNIISHSVLESCGFSFFTYSVEDDYLNLKRSISSKGILYIYSHVPLFISKIKPPVSENEIVSDPIKNRFFLRKKNGLYYLLSDKTLCLTARHNKLNISGIRHFCIDFSFVEPDFDKMRTVVSAYKKGVNIGGSTVFNFKAGLK